MQKLRSAVTTLKASISPTVPGGFPETPAPTSETQETFGHPQLFHQPNNSNPTNTGVESSTAIPEASGDSTVQRKKPKKSSKRNDSGKSFTLEMFQLEPSNAKERNSKDLRIARDEIKVLFREKEVLSADNTKLQGQLREMERREQYVSKKNQKLQSELQNVQAQCNQSNYDLKCVITDTSRAADDASRQIAGLEDKVRKQEERLRSAQEQLRLAEAQHAQMKGLLDVRTTELKGAQAFLTKADTYSGADVIKMVESLNSEIFQFSAQVAEAVAAHHMSFEENNKDAAACKEKMLRYLGPGILQYLTSRDLSHDPLPLQVALQFLVNAWCIYILRLFHHNETLNQGLEQIYGSLRYSEEQSVVGRWRALTLAHLKNSDFSWSTYISDDIVALLIVCGWSKRGKDAERFISSIKDRFSVIEKNVKSIKEVIGEGITSVNFNPWIVTAGDGFNAANMEDAYAENSQGIAGAHQGDPIVCTTDIGLRRVMIPLDGSLQPRYENVMKPKVILASALADEAEQKVSDNHTTRHGSYMDTIPDE